MVTIKMYELGLDNSLSRIRGYLNGAIGNNISKKRKDEAICKAFGAIEALLNIIETEELNDEEVMSHEPEKAAINGTTEWLKQPAEGER